MASKTIFFELILMLSGVFIFWSLWMWLDRCSWLHTELGLWTSLIIGILGSVFALKHIHKCINKD